MHIGKPADVQHIDFAYAMVPHGFTLKSLDSSAAVPSTLAKNAPSLRPDVFSAKAATPGRGVAAPAGDSGHRAVADWICSTYKSSCTETKRLVDLLAVEAGKLGIPKDIAWSVALKESKFRPDAINSRSGDYGLMQVNYRWHKDKVSSKRELLDPETNAEVGLSILHSYAKREKFDWHRALRRYNGINANNNYPQEVLAYRSTIRKLLKNAEG